MIEAADIIFRNGELLTVNIIMCFVAFYAVWRMHGFEKRHDAEFKLMRDEHAAELKAVRDEHRNEREKVTNHMIAALDKLAIETAASNKEREEIKALIQNIISFNTATQLALYDYDRILNQIAAKLDVQARCDIEGYTKKVRDTMRDSINARASKEWEGFSKH